MESTPENKSIKSLGIREEKTDSIVASASGVVTFGVKIENTLNIQDLQAIKDEFMRYGEKEGVTKEEFCNLMDNIMTKGTRNEYAELFDNIDVTKEGYVNWDKFTGHLLLEYVEKDDRVKSTQVPQWKDIKQLPSDHKDIVQKISYIKNTSRYIITSKEGCISTFDAHLRTHKSIKITNDSVKPRDVWVTTFVVLQNINKIALSFTSKEIVFYDLSSKLEFNVQYRVFGLEHTPLSMDYWSNPDNSNEAILVMGDTGGNVNAFHFTSSNIALFDRPQQPGGEGQEQVVNVNFKHLLKDKFKYCRLIRHNGHTEWARQVKYAQHLNCFISCSTSYENAMVLGWIEKAKSKMKTNSFNISQGVNAFAYHNGLNLIATAGVDHHVCLWNPYVVSKAVGLLRGHMAPVVHVQFNFSRGQLISFSKDKVLRIWDVQLQVCLQRMAGMYPKGTEMYTSLFFHEATNRLFTAFNYQLTMLEMRPEVKDRVMSHDKPISMALYNSTFNQVVSACHGSTVIVWMLDTGQKAKQFLNCHGNAEITCLAFDHNETRIFTGSSDGTVKIWDFNGHCHHLLNAGMGNGVDISQIGVLKRSLVVIGWDRYITVFRNHQINQYLVEPSEWKGGKEHQDDILGAAFMAPHTLATGSYDGEIVIWNTGSEVSSRHLQQRFYKKAKSREKTKLSLLNDGTTPGLSRQRTSIHSAQSAHHPSRVSQATRLGSKETEGTKRPTTGSSQSSESDEMNSYVIKQLLFLEARKHLSASGGANLVSCGGNGWVRFWNANKNALLAEFIAHQDGILVKTFGNKNIGSICDGSEIVNNHYHCDWRLSERCHQGLEDQEYWSSPNLMCFLTQTLWEHQDDILGAAFMAPHTLATGSYDGEIVIWNTGSEVSSRHLQQRFYKKAKSREKTKLSLLNDGTTPGLSRQHTSIHSAQSAHHPSRVSQATRLGSKETEGTKRPTTGSSQSSESDEMNSYVIKQLLFLEARKHLSASGGANLVSCGGNGWVRFWNANKNALLAEFIAHQDVGSVVMAVSSNNHYLVTGDSEGAIKVWKIQEYCLHKPDVLLTQPPATLSSWHLHADAVNYLSMCERNERWLIISASADSSVQLADIHGNHIGTFGQEEHWKIEPYVPSPEPTPSEMDEMSDSELSQEDVEVEDKKSDEEMEVDVLVNFDPMEKVNTWESTRLGKQYQEVRKNKRERKQPGTIPDLPYLSWERTNQPPAGPYASTEKLRPPMWTQALDVSELDKVGTLHKPDFISHPHKYFRTHEEAEAAARNLREKDSSPELKQRFDERSLFPKYILDHEAEMKLRHRFLLDKGPNGSAKNKRSGSRVWNKLSSTTNVPQKNPRPFRLSPLQEIVRKKSAEKPDQNQSTHGNAT
eukprot:XP_011674811.1 PREDICTED: WD repeat-containing protein on Y chromosome [Strongylocentrotus purpuratus]